MGRLVLSKSVVFYYDWVTEFEIRSVEKKAAHSRRMMLSEIGDNIEASFHDKSPLNGIRFTSYLAMNATAIMGENWSMRVSAVTSFPRHIILNGTRSWATSSSRF